MKSILWLAWLSLGVFGAFGQGTVTFVNRVTGTLDAPVFDTDGTTKLSGTGYKAQLYASAPGGTLQPVGAPLTFRTGIGAGYVDSASDPGGSTTRTIPGVPAGGLAAVQVRAWEAAKGATYEAALANGGKTGASTGFSLVTGGGLNPPTTLVGLTSFRLQLSGPPTITRQPASVVTGLGGTARFEVVAGGPQPYRYQWRKGTADLPGATGSALVIQPVAAGNAGIYVVRVSNDFGFLDSNPVELTIAPAPVITSVLVSPNPPKIGQPLRLEVVATGTGPITYQWLRDGVNLGGATSSILERPAAEAGVYSIRVTGPGGSTSRDAATVTAEYVLELIASTGGTVSVSPSRATYSAGTTVTLTATTQSGYAFGGWSGDLTSSANPATLVMNGHKRVEAGFRPTGGTVVLANRASSLGLDAPVFDLDGTTKLDGPAFVAQLYAGPTAATLAPVGEPVPFRTGAAAGYLTSADRSIPTVSAGAVAHVQVRAWAVAAGATYEAALASGGKAGSSAVFTVTTGNFGIPPSLPAYLIGLSSFRLQLGSGPVIVQQPRPVNTGLGGTARFEVVASGTEPLTYQWRKGTTDIGGARASVYEIPSVNASHAGSYSVRITNPFGNAESTPVTLAIVAAPTITEIRVSPQPPVFERPLQLEAVVAGTGPFAFQWQLNQVDIPNATAALLEVPAAAAGTYRIRVSGPGGPTTRDAVTVNALYRLELAAGLGGSVGVAPVQATYAAGSTVTLTAAPEAGYAFGGWSGDLTGSANPATLVMNGHKRVEASFRPTAGTVYFANRVLSANLDAPVFDIDGVTRLAGPGFLAQLYGGPNPDSLLPVGLPVGFRTETGAAGYFVPEDRSIPGVTPGTAASVQVRVWVASDGESYEAALAKGGKTGTSAVLTVPTGNAGTPPSLPGYLVGLTSFRLESGTKPSIAKQPAPVVTGLGGTAHFEVTALGSGPLAYQWRKGANLIPGATGAAFDIASVVADDAGLYSVRVTNRLGSVESAAVELAIVPAPTIADLRVSPSPLVGRPLRLEVVVQGTGPFTYSWRLDGNPIPSATGSVYETQVAAPGVYRIVVSGPGGSTSREAVTIVPQFALQLAPGPGGIIQADPAQALYAGGTTVALTAVPEPGYAFGAWAGDASGTANPLALVMNAHKRVEASFRPTGGTVYFANRVTAAGIDAPVYDTDGTTPLAGEAFLAQLYAGPSDDRLAPIGSPVPFRTDPAAGFIAPEDRSLPNVPPGGIASVQMRAWAAEDGATFEEALADGGRTGASKILLVITGNAGTPPSLPAYLAGLKSFRLQSGGPPRIVTPPSALTVVLGQPARFAVEAVGFPAPQFQWRKNGTLIDGATGPSLAFEAVRVSDAGQYSVRVFNGFGESVSPAVPLVVLEPPVIRGITPATTLFAGDSLRLQVDAAGTPPLTYRWFEGAPGDSPEALEGNAASLQTPALFASTVYWVRVENAAGSADSALVAVTVERRPQTLEFGPLEPTRFGAEPIVLTARASSGLPVAFTLVSGPAALDGNVLTPSGPGTVRLRARQPGDARFLPAPEVEAALLVRPALATLTLGGLDQTYTGAARRVTAVTDPPDLAFAVQYAGTAEPPIGAGSYPVVATIADPRYEGSATGTLLVRKAAARVTLAGLERTFDGLPKPVTTSVDPTGLLLRVTYAGQTTAPSAEGDYAVVATVEDPNYQGETTGTLRIVTVVNVLGRVFHDLDGDGFPGSAETGLAGVALRLLALDGTTEIRAATTDEAGAFSFRGIATGSYYLAESNPAGFASTTPDLRLVAVNGQAPTEVNFGDQAVGTVTGTVFEDVDGNGLRDNGEPGIAGVTIRLIGSGGQRTTTTSAEGVFAFSEVGAGSYGVEEIDSIGYFSTTPNLRTVSVAPGGAASAGFGDQAAGTISGVVFEDLNGNGTPDPGEPGLGDVVIRLTGPSGLKTDSTTDAGTFRFLGVVPGTYTIEEIDPVGFSSTSPNSRTLSVPSGGAASASFGDQAAGSVAGVVFADLNGNGLPETGEPGLEGVTLQLVGESGQRVTTTDPAGAYRFQGVEPGPYTIEETDPPGYGSTTPNVRNVSLGSGGAATANFGDQAAGTIAGVVFADLNGNGLLDPREDGLGGVVIRLVGPDGQRQGATAGDGTYQFTGLLPGAYSVEELDPTGFASTTPNVRAVHLASGAAASASFGDQPVETISGLVFEDQNGNGQPDPTEPGVGGVKVLLFRAGEEAPLAETLTSGNGLYVFANVPAGEYTVRQDVPDNYTVILHGGPFLPAPHAAPGAPEFVDQNVRLAEGGAASASFAINVAGQLSGVVFDDLDGNGLPAAGEPGLGGVRIQVQHPETGALLASAVSSGDGVYLVPGLPAGLYRVVQDLLPGYLATTPSANVRLDPGGAATASFPNRAGGTLSGRLFNDENGNGLREPSEPGLGGIRLTLSGGAIATVETTTAGDGSFLFADLLAGELRLEPAVPAGFHATTPAALTLVMQPGGALGANFGLQSDSVRPPKLVAEPADLLLAAGASGEFTVVAEGTEPFTYQWLKAGTPIPGETAPKLLLAAVQPSDEALYQVRVSNALGTVTSRAARLTVGVADPFATWIAGQGLPADRRRLTDDPDLDGLANLMEFVLGTHPGAPTTTGLPGLAVEPGLPGPRLGFELVRSRLAANVRLSLQASDDLAAWSTLPSTLVLRGTEAGGDRIRIVSQDPIGSLPYRFFRLAADVGSPLATPATLKLLSGPPIATSFRLALEGQAGTTYAVEWSADFQTWTFLQDVVAQATAVVVTDTQVGGVSHRFYRATAR